MAPSRSVASSRSHGRPPAWGPWLRAICLGLAVAAVSQGRLSARAQEGPSQVDELRKQVESDNRLHPVASLEWERQALKLLEDGHDARAQIWFLRSEVRDLNTLFRNAEASALLSKARQITARHGTERDSLLLEVEGLSVLNRSGHMDQAAERSTTLLPALSAYFAKNPKDNEVGRATGRAFRVSAWSYLTLGKYPDSIRLCQRSLEIYLACDDRVGQAQVYGLMGQIYEALDQLKDALAFQRSAVAMADQTGDNGLKANIHMNLANLEGSLGDNDAQSAELKLASEFADRAGDSAMQVLCTVNLADAFLRKRDYRQVLHYADLGIKLASNANDQSSVAVSRTNKGIALNRLGSHAEGLALILQGYAYYQATKDRNGCADLLRILAEEYAASGDFRRAYEMEVQFKAYSDGLRKDQDQKRLAEASAAFENDKKQLLINSLERDRRQQGWLWGLWGAIGILGFATAGVLVFSRNRLRAANRSLEELSLRDPLTSLANRRYLAMHISEDLAQAIRLQRAGEFDTARARMAVNIDLIFLMIDIDHFKLVNDQFGHAAGDRLLKQFAFILSQTMRDSDTVVRWGGEEFFVLAKHTSRVDASLVAERIRSRVESYAFDLGNGQTLHKTCSVGFASFPFHRLDPGRMAWEKVLEVADQCLYAAKAMGRNTWVGALEKEGVPTDGLPPGDAYPDLPELCAQELVTIQTRNDQPVVWG